MPESPLVQKEVAALTDLEGLIAQRAKVETEVEQNFKRRRDREEQEHRQAAQELAARYKAESEALQSEYDKVRAAIVRKAQADTQATEAEYAQVKQKIEAQFKSERAKSKKASDESRWQSLAMYEAARDNTIKRRKSLDDALAASRRDLEHLQDVSEPVLGRSARLAGAEIAVEPTTTVKPPPPAEAPTEDGAELLAPPEPKGDPTKLDLLQEVVRKIDEELLALESLKLPNFLKISNFIWPFLLLGAAAGAGGWFATGNPTVAGVAAVAVAAASGAAAFVMLRKAAQPAVSRHYYPLKAYLEEGARLQEEAKDWIKTDTEARQKQADERREENYRTAEEKMMVRVAEAEARMGKALGEADVAYPARLAEIKRKRDDDLKKAEGHYPPKIQARKEKHEQETKAVQDRIRKEKEATKAAYDAAWADLIKTWTDGLARVGAIADDVNAESARRFLAWDGLKEVDGWQPPDEVPPALPFGRFKFDLGEFPHGRPTDERLKAAGPTEFDLPAFVPFPTQSSVLIKTGDQGRAEANRLLQSLMLRFLTSIPPGKVRFTIFDPVGLGENFAAFMHLADYQELLVTSRIWTEARDFDQRLEDLSAHMENVIQKYLRNEFESIEAYNVHAGEVAEPFRVLVVANFPSNFNETAARRLLSIVASGARCGVYALISVDPKLPMPAGLQLKDLEASCINLSWRDGKMGWRDDHFGRFPLTLDTLPESTYYSKLMHFMGDASKNANKVEVPFDFIAPTRDKFWTWDSGKIMEVPLGRAGATKYQPLLLGRGTSQHALVAGKTGSGKSTLLHALIVNAALRYSPDQLELYLIDFKKGVEFKVYAEKELPHAKVIAVESEREFGLSVLQRLDAELKYRGDLYRDHGAQDLKGFREAKPDMVMPRILLVVDEFQEFFVEDDKIAQEVSLLLDRLVRQGRAFGVHVILGSQTLGGAYSVGRATLGQMAIRIALQCSEADAHLILSEDNSAARLLTRPGEAIYNDANGMPEGNNLFQVVWLSDKRRIEYLQDMLDLAKAQNRPPATPIVFEGNLPADIHKNPLLNKLLEVAEWPAESPRYEQAWLGDAIAIKDPTVAVFRPQSGSNLLIIGQNGEAALAMMLMAGVAIAAQHPPKKRTGVKFYMLDGSPVDSWLAGKLGQLKDWLPHNVTNVTQRNLAASINEIACEIDRRRDHAGDADDQAPVYLVIYDLQRFRELRKSDDDFGFSSSSSFGEEKAPSPGKQFGDILREGPSFGVHTIVWIDSVNNMNRMFDRNALREFELRILFQMSANDSSTVIDSPAAGKLGENRALFYSEEENRVEKFRPYSLPDPEWAAEVKAKFAARPAPFEPEAPPEPEKKEPPEPTLPKENGFHSRYDDDAPPPFPRFEDIEAPPLPRYEDPVEAPADESKPDDL
ncbi:FtsK/SpoIIIE domain-containing protein [Paludisphaera mucosa]|uniref:FtsK/SpoIIIE domain-containing protein n=1 Tax=Paludisphaera mucosa TaxID=3030827 RepID=A0ABT6FAT8_9BACT|nr:FtsK/SpoIIIE domain-containing protein [Paludisphaera mucosa]MDG3004692.1 FtsK/SpoIIIE domain-containing protein [Paludisphaera mucosa]